MELRQLILECKQNSLTAQKCLYDLFAGRLFLLCRRYMKTDEDAEEMMLNAWLRIFTMMPAFTFQGDAAMWAWMKRIAINECLMQLRKKENFLLVAESHLADTAGDETALEKLGAEAIHRLILSLPIGYRTVFNLYAVEGYSHKEIAAALHISEGTSKSQLNRARAMLRQFITLNDPYYAREHSK